MNNENNIIKKSEVLERVYSIKHLLFRKLTNLAEFTVYPLSHVRVMNVNVEPLARNI